MKHHHALLLFTALATPLSASARTLSNGDFEATPAFDAWNLDTDGFTGGNDFAIVDAPTFLTGQGFNPADYGFSGQAAKLEADYASNEVLYANTLYQALDLTLPAGNQFRLSFDWLFAGEAASSDESFSVALGGFDTQGNFNYYGADGQLGLITQQSQYGNGHFSVLFAPSIAAPQNFTLEFQLTRGYDNAGSYLLLDNVQLQAVPLASVPLPGGLGLFVSGLIWLSHQLRHRQTRIAA